VNQHIKDWLKEMGMSQQEFADSLNAGVTQSTISRLIQFGSTDKLLLEKICKTHNVSMNWLLTGKGERIALPEQTGYIEIDETPKSIVSFTHTINRLLDNAEEWRKESETWKQLYLSSRKEGAQQGG
jgi:transcriptional regulator with XRE-family HTH domain